MHRRSLQRLLDLLHVHDDRGMRSGRAGFWRPPPGLEDESAGSPSLQDIPSIGTAASTFAPNQHLSQGKRTIFFFKRSQVGPAAVRARYVCERIILNHTADGAQSEAAAKGFSMGKQLYVDDAVPVCLPAPPLLAGNRFSASDIHEWLLLPRLSNHRLDYLQQRCVLELLFFSMTKTLSRAFFFDDKVTKALSRAAKPQVRPTSQMQDVLYYADYRSRQCENRIGRRSFASTGC